MSEESQPITPTRAETAYVSPAAEPAVAPPPPASIDLQRRLDETTREAEAVKQASLAKLRAKAEYIGVKSAAASAMTKLEALRAADNMDGRLAASSDANKKAEVVKAMEKKWLASDSVYNDCLASLQRIRSDLASAKASEAIEVARAKEAADAAATAEQEKSSVAANQSAGNASPSDRHVGPRGGVYHYSKNGKKVYEKKR